MTFAHAFWQRCRERPDRTALATAEAQLSYRELYRRAEAVGRALRELGVGRGDRVAVLAPNRLEVALLMVATATAGAVVAPVNWRLSAEAATAVVADLAPKAVFATNTFAQVARAATDVPVVDLDDGDPRWLGLGASGADGIDPHAVQGSDLITIMSTSGSTGRPKGVAISQAAMVARALVLHAELGVEPSDAFIGWAPLFHISSADYLYATLILGGTFVLLERFDAETIATELVTREVGWLFLIPGVIDDVLGALGTRRPRSLRCAGAMADLVPAEQLREAERRLGAPFLNTFGSTEAGLVPGASRLTWAGDQPLLDKRPTLFCQHRVVDADGGDVDPGSTGELWLRGPTLFSGYWSAGSVSRAEFTDGWFRTGDLVRAGADGALAFVERRGRMFKCGGENVYPATIERALLSHAAIAEATVIPAAHPRFGQVPAAYVALAHQADARAVLESATATLARFERPQAVHVLAAEEFPRGVTGKVERLLLAAAHQACGPGCFIPSR
ncbi:AMP-binding protein [Acrocarpospora sp. B8E8]|uniref:class I adenylate-forming enzyme family protein n=1 Tax=Acrocarpospora sp. B8E8 TaxID=3153572 RepID=UPI00325DA5B1